MNMSGGYFNIIKMLEDNKRFPHYAAERRIDLFLAYFIGEILTNKYGEKVEFVAPEFPVLCNSKSRLAYKADLLCMFTDKKEPLLIELKTDANSFKKNQLSHYNRMGNWKEMIEGIAKMTTNTTLSNNRAKYFYLLQRLVECHLAQFSKDEPTKIQLNLLRKKSENMSTKEKCNRSRIINQLVDGLETSIEFKPKVLYMAPRFIVDKIKNDKNKPERIDVLCFDEINADKSNDEYKYFVSFLKEI
ncbi:MAG: hypothetical protein R8J85_08630 [Mariprofundales bacterium]